MDNRNDITLLSSTPTFAGIDARLISSLTARSQPLWLNKGDILFNAGEAFRQQLFILLSGHILLQRKQYTRQIPPGEVLGLAAWLDQAPYQATAIADTDCRLLQIAASDFAELETTFPELGRLVDQILGQRIRSRTTQQPPISGSLALPVYQLMTSPLASCDSQTSIRQAYQLMQQRKIGSLGVEDKKDGLMGMLTFAGLCGALLEADVTPETPVRNAACETPITIRDTALLWQAEDMLHQHHVKYLVVTRDGKPVGLLSQTDLYKARLKQQSGLVNIIQSANSLQTLRHHYEHMYETASDILQQHRHASQAVQQISRLHLAIQQRCVELTLEEMDSPPPCAYSLIIMGSGGRGEMLLNPDQDNGLIIDDRQHAPDDKTRQWFQDFSQRLNVNLDKAGYILCPGEIMARNPMYHKTLSEWKQQIGHILQNPNMKAARWANIVFDFDTLYGDDLLTQSLRKHLLAAIHQEPAMLDYMVDDDAEGRPPLGLFNRLLTLDDESHKGTIDIKRNGLRLVADAARVYALQAGIAETATRERLNRLVHLGTLDRDLVDSVTAAFDELLDILLQHQINQIREGQLPNKYINPDNLSWQTRSVLQLSMRAIRRLQDKLQGRFGRDAF